MEMLAGLVIAIVVMLFVNPLITLAAAAVLYLVGQAGWAVFILIIAIVSFLVNLALVKG